ncbi:MAG: SDR family NAD(P)-dependent oxidoreductase, partial [Prevotella sp.]
MKQQTIIIIGATSGIGKTLFEKYAADGNRIGIVGRRTHLLDELRQEHPDMTVTATADITKQDEIEGHGDRYIGSLFRVDEPVPDDSLLLLNWFSMNVIVIILGV